MPPASTMGMSEEIVFGLVATISSLSLNRPSFPTLAQITGGALPLDRRTNFTGRRLAGRNLTSQGAISGNARKLMDEISLGRATIVDKRMSHLRYIWLQSVAISGASGCMATKEQP